MAPFPNPLLPGFHPDPSVVAAGDAYYLVTSTFEYLPGIPVFRSTDFRTWTQVGNVLTREAQAGLANVPPSGGTWAPTIRYREGVFIVIVTLAMGRGCMLYTAADPAGPWSDGIEIPGVHGIDPDIAWDDDGTAIVTSSGLYTTTASEGGHRGIEQIRVDPSTGTVLEPAPRSVWSGTGLKFPEAPHLYHIGDWWYLMIAEGGTERGHAISIARSRSPYGPFEGNPANPILSTRSTDNPIQNAGHGDLVQLHDGSWQLVFLGMRPRGLTDSFSALGRETFTTAVTWIDDWPVATAPELNPRAAASAFLPAFRGEGALDPRWISPRREPESFATGTKDGVAVAADGDGLDDSRACFLGFRQPTQIANFAATINDPATGAGGIAIRLDETHHIEIETTARGSRTRISARLRLSNITKEWATDVPSGPVRLQIECLPTPEGYGPLVLSSDIIRLSAGAPGGEEVLADIDGRYLTAEVAAPFTGRAFGLYATEGTLVFTDISYRGSEPTR